MDTNLVTQAGNGIQDHILSTSVPLTKEHFLAPVRMLRI